LGKARAWDEPRTGKSLVRDGNYFWNDLTCAWHVDPLVGKDLVEAKKMIVGNGG
jgi:hypothetical protein